MNLEQNYDAVEGKGKFEPRAISKGDVLRHEDGEEYLVAEPLMGQLALVNVSNGHRWKEPIRVDRVASLLRSEARVLCSRMREFRLVGRAKDVLTVKDPGE